MEIRKLKEKERSQNRVYEGTNVEEDLKVDDAAIYSTTWCSARSVWHLTMFSEAILHSDGLIYFRILS